MDKQEELKRSGKGEYPLVYVEDFSGKISDLPDGLRQLAESRVDPNFTNPGWGKEVKDEIVNAFEWSETEEGDDFWDEIHQGNFKPYYDLKDLPLYTLLTESKSYKELSDMLKKKHHPGEMLPLVKHIEGMDELYSKHLPGADAYEKAKSLRKSWEQKEIKIDYVDPWEFGSVEGYKASLGNQPIMEPKGWPITDFKLDDKQAQPDESECKEGRDEESKGELYQQVKKKLEAIGAKDWSEKELEEYINCGIPIEEYLAIPGKSSEGKAEHLIEEWEGERILEEARKKGTGLEETDVSPFEQFVTTYCNNLRDMLIEKNKSYGNSALDPVRVFSSADTEEQIKVRLDDKLSRIKRGNNNFNEDTVQDLQGYLILLQYKIAQR